MIRPIDAKFKILVSGGRDYLNRELVNEILTEYKKMYGSTGLIIIHGAARGADTLAGLWANANDVEEWKFPITKEMWKRQGAAAGPIRNHEMLMQSQPDIVISFPGGNGTKHMRQLCYDHDFPLTIVKDDTKIVEDQRMLDKQEREVNDILKWCIT